MRYKLPFKLSFIMYTLALFALPYMTAKYWADIIAFFFIVAVCYQLLYLFCLRKKDKLKFGRVIAQYFLYLLLSLELWTVLNCADLAINGYTPTDILGTPIGETVYGWDAITGDSIGLFIFIAIMLTATIYQIIYGIVHLGRSEIRQPIRKDRL